MTPPMFPFRISPANLIFLLAIIFSVRSDNPHNVLLNPINPAPTQCEPSTFRWSGGTPPFFVILYQNGILQRSLGPANGSSLQWDSDLAAGTILQAIVSDSGSASAQTRTFTMQPGPTSMCLAPSSPTTSSSESSGATRSTEPIVPSTSPTTLVPNPSSSSTRSTFAKPTQSSSVSSNTGAGAPTLSPTEPQSASSGSPYISTPSPQSSSDAFGGATTPSSPESQPSLTLVTTSQETNSNNPTMSMFAPPASIAPLQHDLSRSSKSGRVAGIVIGCLVLAVLLAALALVLLRRHRRARERARIASMSTLDTLAFTATTWSDLSASDPDKPLGANKGVTEWNADLFTRDPRPVQGPRKPLSTRSSPSPSPSLSPWVPFAIPHARPRRPRVTSLSTITEAPTTASAPSPVDSDDSASTAPPSLRSYPPLVPQPMTLRLPAPAGGGGGGHSQPGNAGRHAYPPALLPPAQVPVNPFRARLLAAASRNGNGRGNGDGHAWARGGGYGAGREDPFR